MSKTATFGASFTLAASAQGEGAQLDFGPYSTVNVAAHPSPGQLGITNLANGDNTETPFSVSNVANAPQEIYWAIMPLAVTSGVTLTMKGAGGDKGIVLSSVNPSFIPVLPTFANGATQSPILNASANVQINMGYV